MNQNESKWWNFSSFVSAAIIDDDSVTLLEPWNPEEFHFEIQFYSNSITFKFNNYVLYISVLYSLPLSGSQIKIKQ